MGLGLSLLGLRDRLGLVTLREALALVGLGELLGMGERLGLPGWLLLGAELQSGYCISGQQATCARPREISHDQRGKKRFHTHVPRHTLFCSCTNQTCACVSCAKGLLHRPARLLALAL